MAPSSAEQGSGAQGSGAQGFLAEDPLDVAFTQCVTALRNCLPTDLLDRCSRYQGLLTALETETLASMVRPDGNDEPVKRALKKDKKSSRREKKRKTKRANTVNDNPELGQKMSSGELSAEQVDLIADASAKSDGAAAKDEELLRKIAAADPDQGRKIVDDWLARRARANDVNAEHERQRKLRCVRRGTTRAGLASLTLEGDKASVDAMWAEAERIANLIYKADGGRDLPADKHPRTRHQRVYDAFNMLLTQAGLVETSASADSRAPAAASDPDPEFDPAKPPAGTPPARSSRPTVVVTVDSNKLAGNDPTLCAHLAGSGPIPDAVLHQLIANCDLLVAILGPNPKGEPLWLGRARRHASRNQFIALTVRDRGCVLCGAKPQHCQAHHLTPWNAPAKGETNMDQLALVCSTCHSGLHENHHTLYWDSVGGMWKTRAATNDEIAPNRPKHSTSKPQRLVRDQR